MRISKLAGDLIRFGLQGSLHVARATAATGKSAATTIAGPLGDFAKLTVSTGVAAAKGAAVTAPGRSGLDLALRSLNAALASLPGTKASTLDPEELRESFVAAATDSGTAVAHETVDLATATASAMLGDPTRVRHEIEKALERMRLLSGAGDTLDVFPGTPVSKELRDSARVIVDHAPTRLLTALNGGGPEGSSRIVTISKAMLEDADNLRIFAVGYPRVLATLGARVGKLLLTDSLSLAELDAFLAGRRFEVRRPPSPNGNGKRRPSTATEITVNHEPAAES